MTSSWWAAGVESLFKPAWLAQSHTWIAALQRQSRQAIIATQRAERPHWSTEELEPWADSKLLFSPSFLKHVRPPQLDWPDLLRHITCPVLLITGDPALGSAVTERQAAALHALAPQLRHAHIPGAGHNIRRDQLEAYLAVIGPQFADWTGHS